MDYFDLAEEHGGRLANAFARHARRASAWSASTPTGSIRPPNRAAIVHALNAAGAAVSFVELSAPVRPRRFLLDVPELDRVVDGFLRGGA